MDPRRVANGTSRTMHGTSADCTASTSRDDTRHVGTSVSKRARIEGMDSTVDGGGQHHTGRVSSRAKLQKIRAINQELDEEMQKNHQGLGSDQVLDELLDKIQETRNETDSGNTLSGKEFKEEASTLRKFAEITVSKVLALKDDSANAVSMNLLIERFKEVEGRADGTHVLIAVGERAGPILTRALKFNYVYVPPQMFKREEGVAPLEKVKKERRKNDRSAQALKQILGKTTREAHEEEDDESSIMKELDAIRRQLKESWKAGPDKKSVDYYRFVLDPTDFGHTIENMFYISFLARDGRVRLRIDEKTGIPAIEKVSKEDRMTLDAEGAGDGGEAERATQQHITTMTFPVWQELTKSLGMKRPTILT